MQNTEAAANLAAAGITEASYRLLSIPALPGESYVNMPGSPVRFIYGPSGVVGWIIRGDTFQAQTNAPTAKVWILRYQTGLTITFKTLSLAVTAARILAKSSTKKSRRKSNVRAAS